MAESGKKETAPPKRGIWSHRDFLLASVGEALAFLPKDTYDKEPLSKVNKELLNINN